MRYNQLGRTGLYVSELCLGTMTFGHGANHPTWSAIAKVDQDGADAILRRSLDAGINFIDTADVYSVGDSERLLGNSLKNLGVRRQDVVLATKVHGVMGEGPNDRGSSRGHIMDSVEGSLERLQTDHIDLYQIHGTDTITPVDEILRAMDDLISRGLVRYIGLSNWHAWRIAKALGVSEARNYARFESVQSYYSLVGRDLEHEIVPLLQEERLGLMVWSPLAGGLLSGKYGPESADGKNGRRASFDFPPADKENASRIIAAMREIGEKHAASVASVALAWLLAKPYVTTIIIGASRMDQLEQNLGAVDLQLAPEEIDRLDALGAPPMLYPSWMVARQATARLPQPFVPKD